jgi:hypothetical protein
MKEITLPREMIEPWEELKQKYAGKENWSEIKGFINEDDGLIIFERATI